MARTLMRFTGVGGQGVLLAGEIFAAVVVGGEHGDGPGVPLHGTQIGQSHLGTR